jgi:hypothetical protein
MISESWLREYKRESEQRVADAIAKFKDETKPPDVRFEKLMMRLSSFERAGLFLEVFNSDFQSGDTGFWAKQLYREWNGFDYIPHTEFEEVIELLCTEDDDYSTVFLPHLSVEDRAFFDALPEKRIVLYRGRDADDPDIGLSWTRSLKVAIGFARGKRRVNKTPQVLKTVVHKSRVAFVSTDRKEQEVVLGSGAPWTRELKVHIPPW